jgi:hypothetical protein
MMALWHSSEDVNQPVIYLLEPDGTITWSATFGAVYTEVTGISLDGDDAVYVSATTDPDTMFTSVNAYSLVSGKVLWTRHFPGQDVSMSVWYN